MEFDIKKCKYPIWLVHSDLVNKTLIEKDLLLDEVNELVIKRKSLIGCYLVDGSEIYKITGVAPIKRANPFYIFEFFNPMYKIKIFCIKENNESIVAKLKATINKKSPNDY